MALGWLWLLSPFIVIGLISHDREMQRWVATHHEGCRAAGWLGVVMMFSGAAVGPALPGALLFVFGTPLVGLIVWRRDEGDDGRGDDGPGPDVPPVDWDEFERSFWGHVRRGRLPRLPRTPSRV